MPDIENLPLVISVSGGETSSVMADLLMMKWRNSGRKIINVFANTGKEREETLSFLNNLDKDLNLNLVWVEASINHGERVGTGFKVVTYETANRTGSPFEEMIKKYGIPNQAYPHCTRELKTAPITTYLKSLGLKDYVTAIGYRADEMGRVKWEKAKENKQYYPLVETWRANKAMVKDWCNKRAYKLGLSSHQGNCDMCWKKSERKLMTLIKDEPNRILWWDKMEQKYSNLIIESRDTINNPPPYTFFRNNKSAKDLIEDSEFSFESYADLDDLQLSMFSNEIDFEPSGCGSSSCEPF